MGDPPGPSNHPDLESAPPFPLSLPPRSFPSAIKPERVWTVFLVYLLCLIGSTLGSGIVFIIAAIAVYGPDVFESSGLLTEAETSPLVANLALCTVELILLGGAVAAGVLSPVPFAQRLRLHPNTAPVVTYPVMLLGVLAVSQTFESATMLLWSDLGPSIDQLHGLIINASGPALLATIIVVGLGAALGEELLCRGYVQTRLSIRWGPAPGVLIASFLFALLHLPAHAAVRVVACNLVQRGVRARHHGSVRRE